ncbi:hypothetical protein [Sphingopyxis granuli]|uniref:hypothetical protein n=1 Tax=Sphingopyxis granuli TaxID=267128 RepID=UPI00082F44E4|nr:hypothetical protein [Sphingopyxis granuli]
MTTTSPDAIAASLSDRQRDIVMSGPQSFAEAHAIPKGLFDEDESWDRDTGDEWHFWKAAELGRAVRAVIGKPD